MRIVSRKKRRRTWRLLRDKRGLNNPEAPHVGGEKRGNGLDVASENGLQRDLTSMDHDTVAPLGQEATTARLSVRPVGLRRLALRKRR